jgi:FMN phosphatase YigB (HAD superfamily)
LFEAILFDLDGTLLDIDMNYFLRQYFALMLKFARERGLARETLAERILIATSLMINNRDPEKLNQEVFFDEFFKDPAYSPDLYHPFFDEFYHREFGKLKELCCPLPLAHAIVEQAGRLSPNVVIATNPVFPETALRQRMEWAGVGSFQYRLVTSYEVMHFTKPHPEYYREISEIIGVSPERCLMIGNDVGEDLTAGGLGMKTFLVKDRMINSRNLEIVVDWQGYHPDLLSFLQGLSAGQQIF